MDGQHLHRGIALDGDGSLQLNLRMFIKIPGKIIRVHDSIMKLNGHKIGRNDLSLMLFFQHRRPVKRGKSDNNTMFPGQIQIAHLFFVHKNRRNLIIRNTILLIQKLADG